MRWTVRRLHLEQLLSALVVAVGTILFWVPYRLTRLIAKRTSRAADTLATHKVFYGAPIFVAWIGGLAIVVGQVVGWAAAIVALLGLPALALGTVSYGERWRAALRDTRSYITLRTRARKLDELRERQRTLAARLRALWEQNKRVETAQRAQPRA